MTALLAAAFTASPLASAGSSEVVLDNGFARAIFAGASGPATELLAIADLAADGARARFVPEEVSGRTNGGFELLFRRRDEPGAAGAWISDRNPCFAVEGRLHPAEDEVGAARADASGGSAYTVTWRTPALSCLDAEIAATVVVEWRIPPGSRALEARLRIELPGSAAGPLYLAQVKFPTLEVRWLGEGGHPHELVLPYHSGVLLRDPADAATTPSFPPKLAGPRDGRPWLIGNMTLPFLHYYDAATRMGLWLSDDDVAGTFRDYEVERRAGSDGLPVVELRARHLPPDLFASERFHLAAAMRLEALRGDWVDAAEKYRAFLRDPARGAAFARSRVRRSAPPSTRWRRR